MVEDLVFDRWSTAEPVHEPMVVVPVDPGCGGFLDVGEPVEGTVANGEPVGVHSVLYNPMMVSARALS